MLQAMRLGAGSYGVRTGRGFISTSSQLCNTLSYSTAHGLGNTQNLLNARFMNAFSEHSSLLISLYFLSFLL